MKLSKKQIRAIHAKYPNSLELSHKRKPHIAVHDRTNELMVVDRDGLSDFPIKYSHNGQIAYDHPERIPKYLKKDVERISNIKDDDGVHT